MMPKNLRLRLLVALPLLLSAGLALGWFRTQSSEAAAGLVGAAEAWQEPKLDHPDPAKLDAQLKEHSIWGAPAPEPVKAAAVDAAPAPPQWRLAGVISDRGRLVAVIQVMESGKPQPRVEYSKPGDDLPDGSHIVAVAKTAITAAGPGGQRQVRLFVPN
jgi:hypothetical protein